MRRYSFNENSLESEREGEREREQYSNDTNTFARAAVCKRAVDYNVAIVSGRISIAGGVFCVIMFRLHQSQRTASYVDGNDASMVVLVRSAL